MYEIPQTDYDAIMALLQQNILPRYIFLDYGYPLEWACQIEEALIALNTPTEPEQPTE